MFITPSFKRSLIEEQFQGNYLKVWPGAIIEDGDRKSSDLRGPMIWGNFTIFKANCAILTSYIRANPRTSREFCRVYCHDAWELQDSLADFLQRRQGVRRGRRTRALLCTSILLYFEVLSETLLYQIDTSVLLENTPLVKFIRNYILDSSGVFSTSSPEKMSMISLYCT